MATIRVTAIEEYEVSYHPDTGQPISDEEALEVFREDPSYFEWDSRKVVSTELAEEPDPLSTDNPWIAARYSDQTEPSAWFMELTDRCVC